MSADQVKLLSSWVSMFGMRARIALEEKGVEYDYVEENLANKSQLLLESNPVHKTIPVLLHNGKPVCESLIIVQYVGETWDTADKKIIPDHPYDRAIARFWADFVDRKFADAGSRLTKNPPGEIRDQAKADFTESIILLNKALQEVSNEKPFFGGDHLGLVDIAFAPFIGWLLTYESLGDCKVPDKDQCPHFCAWVNALWEQPSVKKVVPDPAKVLEFAQTITKIYLGF
eukprot:c24950_g1_i1 orf=285-971(+)